MGDWECDYRWSGVLPVLQSSYCCPAHLTLDRQMKQLQQYLSKRSFRLFTCPLSYRRWYPMTSRVEHPQGLARLPGNWRVVMATAVHSILEPRIQIKLKYLLIIILYQHQNIIKAYSKPLSDVPLGNSLYSQFFSTKSASYYFIHRGEWSVLNVYKMNVKGANREILQLYTYACYR